MTTSSPGEQPGAAPPDCVFCRIVAGAHPAHLVAEDEGAVAFLDIAAATPGHTLVVPRRHADDLLSATPADLAAVAALTQQVARQVEDRLRPDGITVVQTNRAAGWQAVFHLHFHVVPRWAGDPLLMPWQPRRRPAADLAAIATRLTDGKPERRDPTHDD